MSIGELAAAANLSRRTVRFYVQQKLLAVPHGVGRGKHYDGSHLQQLQRIGQLQAAGHSLDAIRQILSGKCADAPEATSIPRGNEAAKFRAELWRKLKLMDGVELSFDASRFNPAVEDLLALREAVVAVFRST